MILVLHHVEERPVAEIARSLGIPVGTAKWRLHAARGAREGDGGRGMNGRPLTDAQISQALRAHLPACAGGLRELSSLLPRPPPSCDRSPRSSVPSRRGPGRPPTEHAHRSGAAARRGGRKCRGGRAWRLLQRDPIDQLSLEPPTDVPAFVLSSYERLTQLPPVALTWRDSDSAKGRIYVDGSGAVRFDTFASADATEPSATGSSVRTTASAA